MAINESFTVFCRTVEVSYLEFRKAVDRLVETIARSDPKQRAVDNERVASTGTDLQNVLSNRDRPGWLTGILDAAMHCVNSQSDASTHNLLQVLLRHYSSIGPINLQQDSPSPYDFDKMYERLRDQLGIPELFDKLTEKILGIIQSGEVDSVTVLEALQQMVAALKANRTGSYIATARSFNLVKIVMRKWVLKMLKRVPGLKELVESIEETISEGEGKFDKLDRDFDALQVDAVLANMPKLQRLSAVDESERALLPPPKEIDPKPGIV